MNKRAIGIDYEKLAGEYLKSQGYEILEYNFRCHMGEIDIIAKDGGYLVFIEVKYRSSKRQGTPLEAVDIRKQRKISKTASYYCLTHGYGESMPCRFDVVGIERSEYIVVQNAFEYFVY